MAAILGPFVPQVKAEMSRALGTRSGHNVRMVDCLTDEQWDAALRARLREIRGERSYADMQDLLQGLVSADSWKKYELRRGDAVPIRALPLIAKIGGKPLEWLVTGMEPAPKKPKAAKKRKAA